MSARALRLGLLAALLAGALPAAGQARGDADRAARLVEVRQEIARLERELERMSGRERGLLEELERLSAEASLREAELREVDLRLEALGSRIRDRGSELERLRGEQAERRRYLEFRLRELYKAGPDEPLRRLVRGEDAEDYWRALRYASLLSQHDAAVLRDFRIDDERLAAQHESLLADRAELAATREGLTAARARLAEARARQERALVELRSDRRRREGALAELGEAARGLDRVASGAAGSPLSGGLDARAFRGLLDWPARGPVSTRFGATTHPRFGTEVPHPGWDIDAPAGSDVHSVFPGVVAYAEWMRGYGLTAIVDHGHGVLSIYAHAAVLLVERGERVGRGEVLGKVGETGSLRGPHVYFELRVDGKPVDPAAWLAEAPARLPGR